MIQHASAQVPADGRGRCSVAFFNLEALAQGSMDRVLIVTERTPNSPDTHTVGATPRRHQVALDAKRLIIIDSKEDEQQNVWRALGFTPGFHPPTRPGYTEAGMGRETV